MKNIKDFNSFDNNSTINESIIYEPNPKIKSTKQLIDWMVNCFHYIGEYGGRYPDDMAKLIIDMCRTISKTPADIIASMERYQSNIADAYEKY